MILFLFLLLFLVAFLGLGYLVNRFHQFSLIKGIAEERKALSWLLAALPVMAIAVLLYFRTAATVIGILHLMVFWILCDLAGLLAKRIWGRTPRRYYAGACAIVVTACYLAAGWYYAHHVYRTDYVVETDKSVGEGLRVVQISDSHIGSTFDGEGFAEYIRDIEKTKPDVVVITGDFVDDDTARADMAASCRALGNLKTPFGVYYVFGNHDKGYFRHRDFTEEDLRREMEKNHVRILEDESVLIDGRFYLVGRQDRSVQSRAKMEQLTASLEDDKYTIVLDHQPCEFDQQAEAGVDLVLSGHTHGGQMFPIGITGVLSGEYDRAYGREKRKDTTFIVNSGISDWAIPFKTAAISEYVVIDIRA